MGSSCFLLEMATVLCFFFLFPFLFISNAQMPGFVSLDCGGTEKYTDNLGLEWTPDDHMIYGESSNVSVPNENSKQYGTVRYFPADNRKYCYMLDVIVRTRYLVRASFLYGNFDKGDTFPKFDVSIGPTHWSTIVISDENTIINKELILLAASPMLSVCLSNATTGQPFISTLELRKFNDSLYYTEFEAQFFLSLSARINFGAESNESVRYPDDPFDRIWESDSLGRANYLVDVAPGTRRISTTRPIYVSTDEKPPQKVMQTAVVGQYGHLHYRLNLEGFPGNGWACSYFAEIEDLHQNETRKFKLLIPGMLEYSKPTVDVQENAQGPYRLYQPGFVNMSLPYVFPFEFRRTGDSSKGPILNAMEIYKYLQVNDGSRDATVMASFASKYPHAVWAQEGGDPCIPASWSWVKCNADPQPMIVSINLSGKNLSGSIPSELTKLSGLVELWLDGNSFTGPIPDLDGCLSLTYIHLENNQLTGSVPSSLAILPNLRELYLQNNMLSGLVPKALLSKHLVFNYTGNLYLQKEKNDRRTVIIISCCALVAILLVVVAIVYCLFTRKKIKSCFEEDDFIRVMPHQKQCSSFSDFVAESAPRYAISDIQDATANFRSKIGSGGFGEVYYGKMKDGSEIAAKVLVNNANQGGQQFSNEVSLLSKTHHRNLVEFLGYCQEEEKCILVYEFMHNGTLKEHLHGPSAQKKCLGWNKRLEIAEDAARGIEYLHTGCFPAIIHRDLKSSNILLDKNMRAKVSDLGLSKLLADESSVSSVVKGTLGYLDPQYYTSKQLTEKSDVYSFGIILLELLSGQEPISRTSFGDKFCNIVPWTQFHMKSGNIKAIVDPFLGNSYRLKSMWIIAEKALECVHHEVDQRPSMSEVFKAIKDAIEIERSGEDSPLEMMHKLSIGSSISVDPTGFGTMQDSSCSDSFNPTYR